MYKCNFVCFVFWLLFVQIQSSCFGQGGLFPIYVNTGAVDCLYEQNGTDTCPPATTDLCPGGICFWDAATLRFRCIRGIGNDGIQLQDFGVDAAGTNPAPTVPKWTSPPCALEGKVAQTLPSFVCKTNYNCTCRQLPGELVNDCLAVPLTETILLNVTKSKSPCITACDP